MTQEVLTPPAVTTATADTVKLISREWEDSDWLAEARSKAWGIYESMDLPDPYDEEWRRTDVRALPVAGLAPDLGDGTASEPDQSLRTGLSGAFMVDDLEERVTWLDRRLQKQGVRLGHLQNPAHEKLAKRVFSTIVPANEWKYVALNAALWHGGTFLYVPDNVEVELPIHSLRVSKAGGRALFPRALIIVGKHAKVSFIDEKRSDAGLHQFVSDVTEIQIGDGAQVEYYSINRWGDGVYNFNTVRAVLGRDAQFTALAAGIGSKLTKMRIDTEMPKAGANAQILGVTFGNDGQHFDYNTLQNHVGDHTISDLQFKAALTDSSSLVWYGITRINPTAGGSEANQTSRNMLLSDKAKASPIPILEIEAYDVSKCSHGATAGPVDEDELYYLQARAIPRKVAEQMLVEGFFADVVERIPSEALRGRVMNAVIEKAGGKAATLADEIVI